MPDTTRSAVEAASAIGCSVGQIAKSILFKSSLSGRPVLVVASGSNRVNEKGIGELRAEKLEKASAPFVRESTGFAIGGVPPIGFEDDIETWIDEDLLQYDTVWAAAGTPFSVFSITPKQLVEITKGRVVGVK
jgi:prolyl-tRNA editing enzyme YbaK/EbsC (Cys-tRNA(Pro) deacylase)